MLVRWLGRRLLQESSIAHMGPPLLPTVFTLNGSHFIFLISKKTTLSLFLISAYIYYSPEKIIKYNISLYSCATIIRSFVRTLPPYFMPPTHNSILFISFYTFYVYTYYYILFLYIYIAKLFSKTLSKLFSSLYPPYRLISFFHLRSKQFLLLYILFYSISLPHVPQTQPYYNTKKFVRGGCATR